jgi:hypothetical protein
MKNCKAKVQKQENKTKEAGIFREFPLSNF